MHGWNSDVTFSNDEHGNLWVKSFAFIDSTSPQSVSSEIMVAMNNSRIDDLISLLTSMKVQDGK